MNNNNKQLLTIKQLAESLQISEVTVYRWRLQGMPTKKIGTTVRFDFEEVMEWINDKGE